jgi:SAM-dependent methyltransferase
LKPADPVLELCCGTGHFSQWLAEEGYQVAGIDASRAMLAYARKRIEPTQLFHCDARSFFLPRRFRAIVCLYNSLNEFLEPGSVRAVLARAYHHLEPGGWFLFDVVSEQGYARFWTADEVVVDGQITCELRYRFDDRYGLASCSLTLGPSDVPSNERQQLLVQQRPYSIPSVVEELRFAGFELTLVKPLPDGVPQEGRVAILARRP